MDEQIQESAAPAPAPALSAEEQFNDLYDLDDAQYPEAPSVGDVREPEPEPSPRHPAFLISMARSYGFTDQEINAYPTDTLGAIVERISARSQQQRAQQPQQQVVPQQQPAPRPEPEEDVVFEGIKDEDYAPELLSALKKAIKVPLTRVKQLEKQLAETQQAAQVREVQDLTRRVDTFFSTLGPEFVSVFGVGSVDQVKNFNPQAFAERAKVFRRANILHQEEGGDLLAHLAEQVKFLHPKKAAPRKAPAAEEEMELEERKKDWVEGAVAKPTGRKEAPLAPGKEKAIRSVAAILKNRSGPAQTNEEANGHATAADFLE